MPVANRTAHNPTELTELIAQLKPSSILAIGPAAQEVFDRYLNERPATRFDLLPSRSGVEALKSMGKYDLAFVSHMIEYLDKGTATRLLAALRDVHAGRLIAIVPLGGGLPRQRSEWTVNDMLGLGFLHVGGFRDQGRQVEIFAFDIANYKATPDWLNSRYWANPELFDKHWW